MNAIYRLGLLLLPAAFLLSSCQEANGPIGEVLPQGEWTRTTVMRDGREHRSMIFLRLDSAFIADTILSQVNGIAVTDSIHYTALELTTAGDGYLRAVEEHSAGQSDITSQELRYWYFYAKNDSLYFYRGMRLRGRNLSLSGSWNVSAADSAFLGASYSYSFTEDSVTIVHTAPAGIESHTYPYRTANDSLIIAGAGLPFSGNRFEIVPGLALYITSHREAGYGPKD